MLRLWKWYQNCLGTHPIKTQMISSGFIWGFGDIAAQAVTHSTAKSYHHQITHRILQDEHELQIDWGRVAAKGLCGLGFVGPIWHFWFEGLDHVIRSRLKLRPNSFRFVSTKVAVDYIIFGLLDFLLISPYSESSTGKTASQVKEDVNKDFLPNLIFKVAGYRFVPGATERVVGASNYLLYVNFFCLLDSCFLSWLEQQEDAPWKQWFKSLLPLEKKEDRGG
ncbi:pxmp2/4 family protein 2 [Phtheirospermum japonicum]|uniref:Pxmp2/4 family protein 2 n=1 Tax=Phtheirospermum japonicum TaxID=374723 RepID=A0A830B3W3_9LAMI|nr:pxmp2/4 family protein 2 [Phtheirospermum japonicum]